MGYYDSKKEDYNQSPNNMGGQQEGDDIYGQVDDDGYGQEGDDDGDERNDGLNALNL